MKVFKGNIISLNKYNDVFRYLVEDKGKIIYLGNQLVDDFKDCDLIDLGEKALMPSFVDTHQHLASFAIFNEGLNVMDANSNQEILDMITSFVRNSKKKSLIAFGASPYSVREKRLITRQELDKVCPDKEFMMVKYDGHAAIINSKLLENLKDKLVGKRGYHPDTGEMNQEAFFRVTDYITSKISLTKLIKSIQKAIDYQAKKGIGMIHSVSGVGFLCNLDISLEKFIAKSLKNGFQLRVFPQTMDVEVARNRKLKRIGGCFETALDGCFGSADAALNKKYRLDEYGSGVLYYTDEKVIDFCKKANRENLQIEMHAIGDRAFDQAVKALKAALDDYPRKDHRHGIIHACLPTESALSICKEYNIQLAVQTAFIDWKQEPDEYLSDLLGHDRAKNLNPLRKFLDMGIVISAGSDAPCTDPDPISWIDKAVNHSNQSQAISVEEALRIVTYNGYWTSFDEKLRGSLEVGKYADMVILSNNPLICLKEKIKELKVVGLYLNGEKYKLCQKSIVRTLFDGVFSKNKF